MSQQKENIIIKMNQREILRLKKITRALTGVAQLVGCHPTKQKTIGSILSQTT